MKRFLALVFCLLSFPALAGGMMPDIVFATPSVVPFVGLGDIVSGADIYYGLRAYTAAQATAATQPLVNLRNGTTSETCDVLVASNGGLGLTANCSIASNGVTAATFCLGATCYITELYDLSGANYCSGSPCNFLISTAGQQPSLVLNCLGSLPCALANGTANGSTAIPTQAVPWSVATVVERTANFTTIMYAPTANNPALYFQGINTIVGGCTGNNDTSQTAADSAAHAINMVADTGACTLDIDGTVTSGVVTPHTFNTAIYPIYALTGYLEEEGLWPGAFTSPQQSSICHNQYGYWGTSVAC